MKIVTEVMDLPNYTAEEMARFNIAVSGEALVYLSNSTAHPELQSAAIGIEALETKIQDSETKIEEAIDEIECQVLELVAAFKNSGLAKKVDELQKIKADTFMDLNKSVAELTISLAQTINGTH